MSAVVPPGSSVQKFSLSSTKGFKLFKLKQSCVVSINPEEEIIGKLRKTSNKMLGFQEIFKRKKFSIKSSKPIIPSSKDYPVVESIIIKEDESVRTDGPRNKVFRLSSIYF